MKLLKSVEIKATKGTEVIADSKLFSWIDSDFKNYGTDKPSNATKAMTLDVLEMDTNGTFAQIFTNPEKQVLTQGQILEFVKEHKEDLHPDGYGTFFLFKVGDKFVVAGVGLDGTELLVCVRRFSCDYVWRGEGRRRVVMPQLASSDDSLILSSFVSELKTLIKKYENY